MFTTRTLYNPATTEDAPYLKRLQAVEFRPIFIMGFARSGTTLLYNLLSETGAFNYCQSYHIARYGEILCNYLQGREDQARLELGKLFDSLGIEDRIFDKVRVSPSLAEEYSYVLQSASLSRGRAMPFFQAFALGPHNCEAMIELCRKVQFVSGADRPLLLKSPFDFQSFLYIQQLFARAKFVFIHRHPLAVLNSQIRSVRSVVAAPNPYFALLSPGYARLAANRALYGGWRWFCTDAPFEPMPQMMGRVIAATTAAYLRDIDRLPKADYVSIRYEDLCAEPDGTMGKLFDFLEIVPPARNWQALIRPRNQPPLPEAERAWRRTTPRVRNYLTHCGYGERP